MVLSIRNTSRALTDKASLKGLGYHLYSRQRRIETRYSHFQSYNLASSCTRCIYSPVTEIRAHRLSSITIYTPFYKSSLNDTLMVM